jgi:hypothetical protein
MRDSANDRTLRDQLNRRARGFHLQMSGLHVVGSVRARELKSTARRFTLAGFSLSAGQSSRNELITGTFAIRGRSPDG